MSARSSAILLAALALAPTLLGCGSDGTPALTKAAFIKRADGICRRADQTQLAEMARVSNEAPGNLSSHAVQLMMLSEGDLPPLRAEAEAIAELGAPAGDEEEIEAIVAGIESAAGKLQAKPSSIETVFNSVNATAKRFGFTDCSEVQ